MKFSERRLLVSLLPTLMLLALAAEGARGQCPGDGFWDSLAPMPDARKWTSSAVVDGKIYVFGDHRLNALWDRVEAYDPQSNTWTQPLAPIPTGRGMAAAAVVDGIIYLIGGNDRWTNRWLTTNEAYDPATNSWDTTLEPMPTTNRGGLTATAVDGLIYVMGGGDSYDPSNSPYDILEVYNPANDSWENPLPGPMLRGRAFHAAVVIGKEIYLIGGLTGQPQQHVPEVDVFNTVTRQWRQVAPLPTVRFDLTAVVLGGRIYAMGGNVYQTPIIHSIVEEYDPRLDCWTGVTALPIPQTQQCAAVVGNTIYSIGGTNDPLGVEALADNLGGAPRPVVGDMNGDGVVDALDIEGFIERLFGP